MFPENDHRRHRPRSWLVNGVQKVQTLDFLDARHDARSGGAQVAARRAARRDDAAEHLRRRAARGVRGGERHARSDGASSWRACTSSTRRTSASTEEPMKYKGTMTRASGANVDLQDARNPIARPAYGHARRVMLNLWHDLPPGRNPPEEVTAVIEIPFGQPQQVRAGQGDRACMKLDRVLYLRGALSGRLRLHPAHAARGRRSARRARAGEGADLSRAAMIDVRPIGVLRCSIAASRTTRSSRVPLHDPYHEEFFDIADIPQHMLKEVEHFFSHLQGSRGEAGADRRVGEERRGDAGDHRVDRAVRGRRTAGRSSSDRHSAGARAALAVYRMTARPAAWMRQAVLPPPHFRRGGVSRNERRRRATCCDVVV